MGSFSLIHWLVVILVLILLFGRGKISDLMGDMAKGINSFKKGLADGDAPPAGYVPPPQGYAPPPRGYQPHLAPPQAPQQQPVPPVRDDIPRS
jgi:sec-independent protein translocase protein TatA